MKIFGFGHEEPVKVSCCNWEVSQTFWLAESREKAEEEMVEKRDEYGYKDREPHGLCGDCMADLLAGDGYTVTRD